MSVPDTESAECDIPWSASFSFTRTSSTFRTRIVKDSTFSCIAPSRTATPSERYANFGPFHLRRLVERLHLRVSLRVMGINVNSPDDRQRADSGRKAAASWRVNFISLWVDSLNSFMRQGENDAKRDVWGVGDGAHNVRYCGLRTGVAPLKRQFGLPARKVLTR